jgi:hypothetical protein
MKKLTLTFCALFALLAVAPAYADGPERYSGKEKEVMQPAPPTCDLYRAHEWNLDIWGAYGFAADTGQFDVPNEDPFTPDIDPFTTNLNFPPANPFGFFFGNQAIDNPNERVNIGQVSKNQLFGRDDTFGGGVDMKYFWSRYFGAGIEALGLAAKTNFAGGGLLTLTARYPWGRFAPYVTGGLGFIEGGSTLYKFFHEDIRGVGTSTNPAAPPGTLFVTNEKEYWTIDPVYNHHARMLGQIGAGLEFRMTCHIGLMADVTWNFVFGQSNHADKIHLITENGADHFLLNGVQIFQIPTLNTANELRPGHGSDNQDFGMARFGVTFSY